MTLRDDAFLQEVPLAEEPRPDFKQALRGIGDPMARQGFWEGFSGAPVHEDHGPFKVGDVVEYVTPDQVKRVGSLLRPYDDAHWLVQVDANEQHIVPLVELQPSLKTPRHAQRAEAKAALQRTSTWSLRRQPETRADGTVLLTVDTGHAKAAEAEVRAFAAQYGLEAVDMSQEHNLLRIVAQAVDSPPENQEPGLETEEIEGTGKIAQTDPHVEEPSGEYHCSKCGEHADALDEDFDFEKGCPCGGQWMPEYERHWAQIQKEGYQLGATVEDEHSITRAFRVPHRYITPDGKHTDRVAAANVPYTGHFELNKSTGVLKKVVYAQVEPPYSSGTGPESTREDYEGDDGDYIVKAKQAQKVSVADIVKTVVGNMSAVGDEVHQVLRSVLTVPDPAEFIQSLGEGALPRLLGRVASGRAGRGPQQTLFRAYRNLVSEGRREYHDPEQVNAPAQAPAAPAPAAPAPAAPASPQQDEEDIPDVLPPPPAPPAPPGQRTTLENRGDTVRIPLQRQGQAGMHNRQKPLGHQIRPKLERVSAQGQYLCIDIVWDPENTTGMSDGNIRHNVITWLKGLATLKEEHPDLGFLGKPRFKSFDPDAGMARLLVRSSEGRSFPQEVVEVAGEDNDVRA